MSTYLSQKNNFKFNIDSVEAPNWLKQFLRQLVSVDNLAPRTICTYYVQMRNFARWTKCRGRDFTKEQFLELSIMDVLEESLLCLQPDDILEYLAFSDNVLENGSVSRSLKLSTLKRYYKYAFQRHLIAYNPTEGISRPKQEIRLPKYLTIEKSERLLESIKGDFPERDYCIITFFLNCGMRLSELAAINISDIHDGELKIFGKGRKERMAYLNPACQSALDEYLLARGEIRRKIIDEDALWISKRTGKRLTARRIEQMVDTHLRAAGLGGQGYSPHKLRHTAATLMYQNGSAQLLELAGILGHANTTTTELYTHLSQDQLRDAMMHAPLGNITRTGKTPNAVNLGANAEPPVQGKTSEKEASDNV